MWNRINDRETHDILSIGGAGMISRRSLLLAAVASAVMTSPLFAGGISGKYVEARTCDVWTGPCFANAEMNISGKHAVIGWKVETGTLDGVHLDGLSVVAVVAASDTLGAEQTGSSKTLLIVDAKADPAQREALIRLARMQGQNLVSDVFAVEQAKIQLEVNQCQDGGCAVLKAGKARIETRCLDGHHDKVCGNESAYYPPLTKDVTALPAMAVEHSFTGKGFNETWKESERRGAYVGSFEMH
jgi:hypothetical protein